jgi:predicted ATPase/DNA-binding winged helix-turn-helix (wHTH) protein
VEPLWIITLFGELTLRRPGTTGSSGDAVHRFRSQKAASLLAFLAYHRGRAYSREFLCELLWPEEDPEVARNRLRVTLASLRRQLEPPGVPFGAVLETFGNGTLRLRAEAITTDVADFEVAARQGNTARAAELYHSPLLPMLYEDWISAEQERLTALAARHGITGERQGATTAPGGTATGAPTVSSPDKTVSTAPAFEIPLYLTRFIGREEIQARLNELLSDASVRLVTLTGPGGNGKTRLAVEAARRDSALRGFIPLADLWEAARLGEVLRQSLSLPPDSAVSALAQVADHLRAEPGPVRLVLDNLEQIAQGAAPILTDLLARTPNLSLLVTSRRVLDIPGERELAVPPLEVVSGQWSVVSEEKSPTPNTQHPTPFPTPTTDHRPLTTAPAVALFADRAQAVRPDFQITERNATAVAELCRLLDGVPLAIELVAARAGTLTVEQMLARLKEREDDFAAAPRLGKEDRHRSLNAVIEWSYALLPPDLRRFFVALAVFRGGWELEAAEAVTGESHALDLLSRLRGHSLITPEGARFRLLETLRAWAAERLDDPERSALADRHASYFLKIGEALIEQGAGPGEAEWLDRLQRDEANLRAAFEYILNTGSKELALRFALVLHALGRARGSLTETLQVMDRALALPGDTTPDLRARVLLTAGALTQTVRGPAEARPYLEAALPLARESKNASLTARTLRSLADNALFEENYAAAQPLYEEALSTQQALGEERAAIQTMNSMALLAMRHRGDFAEARRLTEAAADYFRRTEDRRMLSYNVYNLGELAFEQGDMTSAEEHYRESLNLSVELGDEWHRLYSLVALSRIGGMEKQTVRLSLLDDALPLALRLGDLPTLAVALRERAEIARGVGDFRLATMLLAAVGRLHAEGSTAAPPDGRNRFEAAVAAVRAALPARSFDAAWKKGSGLTPAEAVSLSQMGGGAL